MNIGLLVYREQVESIWPHIEHYIGRAVCEKATTDDLKQLAINGYRQLWLCLSNGFIVGACLTSIDESPRAKWLSVTMLGGDGGDWSEMMKSVEDYAKSHGCGSIEIVGRRGWTRRLSGYSEKSTIAVKVIA
jgi:hypothetical protein